MGAVVSNNAWGALAVPITAEATQILLSSGQGDRFPSAVEGVSWFFVTLVDTSNNVEIVKCSRRMGDTLTVSRGADNTLARAFPAGSRAEVRPCAALFDDKVSQDNLDRTVEKLNARYDKSLSEAVQRLEEKITEAEGRSLSRTDFAKKEAEMTKNTGDNFLTKKDAEGKYLKLTGGTISGKLTINGANNQDYLIVNNSNIRINNGHFGASGDAWARSFHSSSDRSLKEDIVSFEQGEGGAIVNSINPVWFTWSQNQNPDFGVIAQEIEKVLPEAVFENEGRKFVNYPSLVAVAFAAIKDLQKEIEELKKWQKS